MNSIYTRRSVRSYQDKPVEKEKLIQMLKAGMQAPSARNQQGWEFVVIEDKETLKKISELSPGSKMTEDAAFSILLLANFERMPVAFAKWQQDLGACTQNMMLEASELGLGTVWIGLAEIPDRVEKVVEIFDLPSNISPFCFITGGYPLSEDANYFVDRFDESRIYFEKYK